MATPGIKTLLDAEHEAYNVVAEAREYRNQRVKDARTEASKEIEALKAKADADFAQYQKAHSGDSDTLSSRLEASVSADRAKLQDQFAKNKAAVVDLLLNKVTDLDPRP